MANEFIMRKGYKSLANSEITGSLTTTGNILLPNSGQQLRIGSFTDGSANSGEYANDDLVIGDGSITIYPHRRGDYGLNQTTATSTTFRSKLNIWSDNEDHITFGGASTHLVSAWEDWKIWINNDSTNAGNFRLYNKSTKVEFARFSGGGSSFLLGDLNVTGDITGSAFKGDGSGLTGVTAEWDGSHTGNASITGDLSAQGFHIDGATLSSYHDFQSKPIDADSGLFTVGGHGMQNGYTRALSLWSSTDGVWNSWIGTNLRWDGTNFKRASDNGSANWGNVSGIRFLGNASTTGASMQFVVNPPTQTSAPSGEQTVGTAVPSSWTALSIDNDKKVTAHGALTTLGDANFTGYLQAHSTFYVRSIIQVMNKAANGFLTLGNRNTSGAEVVYDLSYIGTITAAGKIQGAELEGTSLDINGNADISGNLTVNRSQGVSAFTVNSAGNGGWTQYASTNDGIYGYIGAGSHLLSPVVNDNDFVIRAQEEFAVSIAATEKFRINSSGNSTFAGTVTAATAFIADAVSGNNNDPGADNLQVSGYGLIGNRGNLYITNASTNSAAIVQIGVGGTHNAAPKLSIGVTNSSLSTNFKPGADSTYDIGSNASRWANVYADNLYGDGSNLTNITATSYSETDTLDSVADRGATTNQALTIGAGSTNGGRVLSQNYSGANRLGVISSNSSSGNFLIGYGAEGKVSSSGNFVSTYGNFSGGHAALSISGTHLRWYAEASNSTTTIGADLTLANVFSVDRVGNLDVAGEIEGASLDINGNADISGTLNIGDKIITTAGGSLFRKYVSSWTGRENQDLIYQGWNTNTSDYIYLKAPGNSSTDHSVVFISDNVIAFGRTDVETGAPELTSAAAPISENWLVVNSSTATFAGHVSATNFRPTNIITNKVVKFNGTQLDDSIMTDDGSTVSVAGDMTVTGTITAQEFKSELISSSIIYESGSTKFGDTSGDNHDFTGSLNLDGDLTLAGTHKIIVGPNTSWSKSLIIGDNANNSTADAASIGITNGNLHLDAATGGSATYLNYYDGTAGVAFGNGAAGIVAWMGPDGDLWKGSSDNNGSKYWHSGNDGPTSGLAAQTAATATTATSASHAVNSDQINGFTLARIDNAEAFHTFTGINAASTQAKRYHIGRLYGCPAHWDGNWQNMDINVTAESYESGHLRYRLMGDYGGAGSQANMMDLYLKEASGPMVGRFRFVLGTPVDAGWDHSGQDTFYVDLYAEASHYSQWEINIKTYGHGTQNTNPTSGGATTVFYDTPTVTNISTFDEGHATIKHLTNEIYHEGHLPTYAEIGQMDYSNLTGTIPTWNQDTTGLAATATSASHSEYADAAGTATSASHATTALGSGVSGTVGSATSASHSEYADDAGNATTVTNGVYTTGAQTITGLKSFAGAIRITETGTAQHILIGNQDSAGTNKPSMIMGVNGQLKFGYGNSWVGEGGTFTSTLTLDASQNATFAGDITAAQHFKATASNMSFHAGGTQVLNIDVNKNIYPSVDGDTDLGFSDSSYRFRNGYFTGELQGGSLDINGNADISGNLTGVDSITASSTVQAEHLYSTDDLVVDDDASVGGNLTVDGTTYGIYHAVVDDQYYFDDYNGSKNINLFYKNTKSDILRYRQVDNYEYWNGSAWVADSSKESSVKNLLDGRQDTSYSVPARDYKFRFTTSLATGWPTMAMIWMQSSWTGSTYPGATMTIEHLISGTWTTKVTAAFTSANGVSNWGTAARADTALHDGNGSGTNTTRITIDFYGWTPSNSSYTTIPLQNLMITSNFSGTENTDYTNLLDYDRNVTIAGNLVMGAGKTVDGVDISALPTSFAPTTAEQNVQSDWNATSGDALILNKPTIPSTITDYVSAANGGTFADSINVHGNILLTGAATTTNQSRTIDFTGFDKEGTTDSSDRAYIRHTVNTGGHAGSVLEISSQNDVGDGIAFSTHASSLLRHNGNAIFSTGHKPTFAEIETTPTTIAGYGITDALVIGTTSTTAMAGNTTIPTDHGDHDGLYLPIGGGTVTGDLTVNGKITQAGVVDREEWGRTYAASITTIATLLTSDGSALPTGGAYRMTGHISGTGTEQVSVAVFWNENGTWYCNNTFAGGTSSNHIEFLISGSVPKIKTWHANNYNINVTHERLSLDEGTGTDNLRGYFGADSFLKWTESTNALVVPGSITGTSLDINGNADISGNITISGTGIKSIQSGGDIALKTSTGEYALYGAANGNTNLYYNGVQHFRTGPDGVVVTGDVSVGGDKYTLTVNAPTSLTTSVVNDTINVTFTASTTTNIDNYLVFSSVAGGDYGLISVIPPADFGATMSIIDDSFNAGGTQAYRVYAVKNGVYSSPLTGSQTFTVGTVEPTNMSVVNLNTAFYIQYDAPSSKARFVTAYNIYKHEHATQSSLARNSATLIYSGINNSYMYQISGNNNDSFHKFWVETTVA